MKIVCAPTLLALSFLVGCGSTTVDPTGGGGTSSSSSASSVESSSASSTSTSATPCTPGKSLSCTCHAVSAPGVATCLPDGSGYGPCLEGDGGTCACPLGRGDGCCMGDGLCCACVQGCDPSKNPEQDPPTDALIACVCAAGVCATECKTECAGGGIGADCAPCVKLAGMNQCKTPYQACGGT